MDRRQLELLALRTLAPLGGVALLLGLVEVGCRAAGHDFARAELERVPPGLRWQDRWGGAAHRRQGPVTWRGQPLRAACRYEGLDDARLADEPEVEVVYDRQGFRNAEGLADWRVAVAGDELTDQGDLPAEELFTTHLAARLGVAVKNLGCGEASTPFELEYLRRWGQAPGCTTWVVVLSEGDDLAQLPIETLHRRGIRLKRLHDEPQPSATVALCEALAGLLRTREDPVNGYLLGAGAVDTPVRLIHAPPSPAQLGEPLRALFEATLEEYRETAREAGVEPWLAFMPAKERLYHRVGRLELVAPPAYIANWRPTDLPAWVAEVCGRVGVRFVDLTEDLVQLALARGGPAAFRDVYGHTLTAAGSRCVAETLARALEGSRR